MFGNATYLFYTLIFCIPPLLALWLNGKFSAILRKRLRPILVSTLVLTGYGNIIWPIARENGAWSYHSEKILGIQFFHRIVLEDIIWWACIGFLFSSFVALSAYYEERGIDIVTSIARQMRKR